MIGLLLVMATALGAPGAGELTVWGDTALDGRPNLVTGAPYGTVAQRLGLQVDVAPGLRLVADGGLRGRAPEGPYSLRGDVWRASLRHEHADFVVEVGRLVRLDARGFARLDGASMRLQPDKALHLSLWGGRLWTPLTWDVGNTLVGGMQMHWRPPTPDGPSRSVELTAGFEARGSEEGFRPRLMTALTARGPRGVAGSVVVEGQLADAPTRRVPLRAEARLGGPVGREIDLSGQLAWQGLDHPGAPDGVATPFDLMVDDGYGQGGLQLLWRRGAWQVDASAGATVQVDGNYVPVPGGQGRVGFGWRGGHLGTGAYGRLARIGTSALAGGGLVLDGSWSRVGWHLDTAAYRFEPLDGDVAFVWEARGQGRVLLTEGARRATTPAVALALDVGAGTDRSLSPWGRAGLALQVDAGASWGPR